jgi:hypothetical protein
MTAGAFFWCLVGAVSAAIFFGIAVVVAIRGLGELRTLFRQEENSNNA